MEHILYNNCNEYTLLSNSDIKILTENYEYSFHIPTLLELYTSSYDPSFFIGIMTLSEKEIAKKFGIENFSRIGYIKEVLSIHSREPMIKSFLYFLQICCKGKLRLVDDWLVLDSHILSDQVLDFFTKCFSLGMGYITQEDFKEKVNSLRVKKTPEEIEWEERQKRLQDKISAARSKSVDHVNIEKILTVISYEFGVSFEDLMNKNFYTIYCLYSSSLAIDAHRVSLIAAGNGLMKDKYKHWIFQK